MFNDESELRSRVLISPDSKFFAFYVARFVKSSHPSGYIYRFELLVYSVVTNQLKEIEGHNIYSSCYRTNCIFGLDAIATHSTGIVSEPGGFDFSPDSRSILYYFDGKLYAYALLF